MFNEIVNELTKSADLQSLQYLAAVKVAIIVCESEDVQSMLRRFLKSIGNAPVGFSDGQWTRLRGKARRKLDQIGVPKLIIDVVLDCLWPISFEIFKWIRYHIDDIGFDCSPNFCWTPRSNIDYVKTAKILIENKVLDIKKRFKLACLYCLEFEVRSLWGMMTLLERRIFYNRGNLRKPDQNPVVFYWAYYIQEVHIDYWKSKALKHTHLLKYAVENGYLSAVKFFFGKLKTQQRNRMVLNGSSAYLPQLRVNECILRDHLAIAIFLIGEVGHAYGGLNFLAMSNLAFHYFLEWPMQKHFMVVVEDLRNHVSSRIFGSLLERIFEKGIGGFKDYDYNKLFMEFWLQSPEHFKTYVNMESKIGFRMFLKLVKKHFGFVVDSKSFSLKAKFRALLFQQEIGEDDTYFEKENVEFFKFFVRERVTTRSSFDSYAGQLYMNSRFQLTPVVPEPLGELLYLMDQIV